MTVMTAPVSITHCSRSPSISHSSNGAVGVVSHARHISSVSLVCVGACGWGIVLGTSVSAAAAEVLASFPDCVVCKASSLCLVVVVLAMPFSVVYYPQVRHILGLF
jgi:hypothetical protein